MKYISTRDDSRQYSAAQAIHQGLAPDGGLFLPQELPTLNRDFFERLCSTDYCWRATEILALFLEDYSHEELEHCIQAAYGGGRFEDDRPAPLAKVSESEYFLELWHGPTCAFKDMALQLLPKLLPLAAAKTGCDKETVILVATSGDTGKAALEGFRDVEGTRIQVFYPEDGVSPMQKRQMVTQQGGNVRVTGIRGNFDDAQTGVKRIFGDRNFAGRLEKAGYLLSSANSINWGRLVPQIVYYISAYCDLVADGEISMGEKINFCVPTGNFGNILAAYYAKKMGLPVGRLICASNSNHVLTDFIRSGCYDRNREFLTTLSPSMDILVSSNLERLLFDLCGRDPRQIRGMMEDLRTTGTFRVDEGCWQALQKEFFGAFCNDQTTKATIRGVFDRYSYLCDPHTAVAVDAAAQYRAITGDRARTVIVSTASPYKFAGSVLEALGRENLPEDDFEKAELLEQISGVPVPQPILELRQAQPRFHDCCAPEEMEAAVAEFLTLAP